MPDQDQGPWTQYQPPPPSTSEEGPWKKYGAKPPAAPQTPEEKAAVQQRNATPTQFEKENTPTVYGEAARTAAKIPLKTLGFDTNSRSPITDLAKGALQSLGLTANETNIPKRMGPVPGRMGTGVVDQMNDLSREAMANLKTGRSVEPAHPSQTGAFQTRPGGPVQRLGDPLAHPVVATAIKTAASMLPVIGPGAAHAGHELARATTPQEFGEGIADVGGTAGQAFLATEPGQRLANEAIERVGGGINRNVVKPVVEGASNLTSRLRTPEAQKATTQAIQPGVNIPRAQESIGIAGPRLQQLKQSGQLTDLDGNPIHELKSNGDLVAATRSAQKHIIGAIEQRLGPVAELQQDTSAVARDMRASISKRMREQYPEEAAAIEKRAATYDKPKSLRDINDAIIDANDDLKGFYKRPIAGESSTSGGMKATQAEVKQLRAILDSGVEKLSGDGVADLKREWGAQRDIERAAARQHAIATRQKGANLWEGLAALHAAGDFVSGNLLGAVKGAATMAMGKRLALLRDPEYLINQAFQGKKAFAPAEAIPPHAGPPPPKALLPKPATEAGFTQPPEAPTRPSYSRSYGGVSVHGPAPKALLPAPKVSPELARQALGSAGGTVSHAVSGGWAQDTLAKAAGLVDKGEAVKGSGVLQFEIPEQPGKTVALTAKKIKELGTAEAIGKYVREEVAKKTSAPTADELKSRMFGNQ